MSFVGRGGLHTQKPVIFHDSGKMSDTEVTDVHYDYDIWRSAYYMKMSRGRHAWPVYLKYWSRCIVRWLAGRWGTLGYRKGAESASIAPVRSVSQ